jgi:hypothetical protein
MTTVQNAIVGLNRVLHHHLTLTFDICLALLYNNNNNTTNQRVDKVAGRMFVSQFDSIDGCLHVLHTKGTGYICLVGLVLDL